MGVLSFLQGFHYASSFLQDIFNVPKLLKTSNHQIKKFKSSLQGNNSKWQQKKITLSTTSIINRLKDELGEEVVEYNIDAIRIIIRHIVDANKAMRAGKKHENSLLICGPSGAGKDFILKTILKVLSQEYYVVNADEFVGETAHWVSTALFGDTILENTYRLIMNFVIIDEVDKIFPRSDSETKILSILEGEQNWKVPAGAWGGEMSIKTSSFNYLMTASFSKYLIDVHDENGNIVGRKRLSDLPKVEFSDLLNAYHESTGSRVSQDFLRRDINLVTIKAPTDSLIEQTIRKHIDKHIDYICPNLPKGQLLLSDNFIKLLAEYSFYSGFNMSASKILCKHIANAIAISGYDISGHVVDSLGGYVVINPLSCYSSNGGYKHITNSKSLLILLDPWKGTKLVGQDIIDSYRVNLHVIDFKQRVFDNKNISQQLELKIAELVALISYNSDNLVEGDKTHMFIDALKNKVDSIIAKNKVDIASTTFHISEDGNIVLLSNDTGDTIEEFSYKSIINMYYMVDENSLSVLKKIMEKLSLGDINIDVQKYISENIVKSDNNDFVDQLLDLITADMQEVTTATKKVRKKTIQEEIVTNYINNKDYKIELSIDQESQELILSVYKNNKEVKKLSINNYISEHFPEAFAPVVTENNTEELVDKAGGDDDIYPEGNIDNIFGEDSLINNNMVAVEA